METKEKEKSIIEIIQQMVANGDSEENILNTLKDIGVPMENAKRLLLVGQADTFALLRSEISKIVKSDLELEKPRLTKYIDAQAQRASEAAKVKIEQEIISDLQKYEKDITGQSKTFQEQIGETVKTVVDLSDRVRDQLNALGTQVDTIQGDLGEMKVKGLGVRNRIISLLFILLGVIFCGLAGYFAYQNFNLISAGIGLPIDAVIILLVVAMIGITLLFVASLL